MTYRFGRTTVLTAVAAAAIVTPATSSAELRMKWDCYMPDGEIDCGLLRSSLTSKIPFLSVVHDVKNADVSVTVTSVPAENGTRFKFDFVAKRVDGYAPEVHTVDKIPSSVDSATAIVRVLTKLERGLDDFMDQKVAAGVENGTLTIRVVDPVRPPFSGRPEQSGMKWYLTPSVGTYFSDVQGVGINASGSASLSFNYSLPTWRLQQWVGANYNEESQPVPGTNETASISFLGGSVTDVVSRSLTKDRRWNVALLLSAEKNPQANYEMRGNGSAGLEYDVIPRQTVNQKNFGFRCAIGPEFQRYDAVNVEGIREQAIGRQFCDVFINWHFVPVDVWTSVGETSVLEDLDYRSFSARISATWRVTDDLAFSPWVSLQQINKAINEAQPTNVVYTDAREEIEASMLAAVERGYTAPFGVQSGFSLRYYFGNGSLSEEDQRWKNVSNLR